MKKLSETVKQMLDALAYAHAGEYLTSRKKSQILAQGSGTIPKAPQISEPVKTDTGSHARRVALYLGSELPPEVMEYVVQTCARLKHQLTVLTFESENTGRALLEPHRKALDEVGVKVKLVTLGGGSISDLARYLRSHPEIAFLVCKDSGYLGRSYLNGRQRDNALPIPVVIVADTSEGSDQLIQPAADHKGNASDVA